MLNDLFGYFKRNVRNMKKHEKNKMKTELLKIIELIDQELL